MTNQRKTSTQDAWLAIHCRNHPDAAGYPRERDRNGNENIHLPYEPACRALALPTPKTGIQAVRPPGSASCLTQVTE